ncbi:MAG: ATP-binding cassette domain-containing protein [Clostridium sp.]|uniref:ATP-binding cassette domain-containing protein n=1 Tax=Clostridium sp. TaxID=1506 RepID=UPI0025804085|nr:ATP-binding cassette domain-containing protein [Clostridium sp.]MBS4840934.1 ATP-binding cassette domain-containing protein [Clostridium sp.]
MLKLDNITAAYNGSKVLHGVSLKAEKGKVTCLIGRNGVGKSTTLKSIMGLVQTPSGDISIDNESIFKKPTYALGMEANKKITKIPDHIFETFPILKEFLDRKGGDLSGGQQQQLAIARAVISEPKILILDEPTEGIQPSIIQDIGRIITKLKENMAVLIVEQYLEFVLEIADECYVMEKGKIVMSGETECLDKKSLQSLLSL